MYSSSYKHRPATLSAFEDAYAKEAFLKRSASSDNKLGCTPYSENVCRKTEKCRENEEPSEKCTEIVSCDEKTPSVPCKPKGISGLLSGMDGGDILLVLLILFFLSDKDSENDGLIPVLLSLLLLF